MTKADEKTPRGFDWLHTQRLFNQHQEEHPFDSNLRSEHGRAKVLAFIQHQETARQYDSLLAENERLRKELEEAQKRLAQRDLSSTVIVNKDLWKQLNEKALSAEAKTTKLVDSARDVVGAHLRCLPDLNGENIMTTSVRLLSEALAEFEKES